MKASDLMIGDWVQFFSKYVGNAIGVIGGIEPREGSVEPSTFSVFKYIKDKEEVKTHVFFGVSRHFVKGIPLTQEILEKNGFARLSTTYLLQGNDSFWLDNPSNPNDYKDNYWIRVNERGINIKYVHELQHALKLCGIEKEIVL